MQVFQIAVSSTYGVTEFKENLLALYTKAGVKGVPTTFLITDNQIVNEKFLVYINDFLSTGFIADLCTPVGLPASELACLYRQLFRNACGHTTQDAWKERTGYSFERGMMCATCKIMATSAKAERLDAPAGGEGEFLQRRQE